MSLDSASQSQSEIRGAYILVAESAVNVFRSFEKVSHEAECVLPSHAHERRRLTLHRADALPASFAAFRPPLMSNVRPQGTPTSVVSEREVEGFADYRASLQCPHGRWLAVPIADRAIAHAAQTPRLESSRRFQDEAVGWSSVTASVGSKVGRHDREMFIASACSEAESSASAAELRWLHWRAATRHLSATALEFRSAFMQCGYSH
jgi:hypothetical protein